MGGRELAAVASMWLACGQQHPVNATIAAPDCVRRVEPIPAVTPAEPAGEGCLTHAGIAPLLVQLATGIAPMSEVHLVVAACRKRAYMAASGARFVFWDSTEGVHGKMSTKVCALPTEACIQRAIAVANELVPFAAGILKREADRHPELWRDPDVGAVSFLECDAAAQPSFRSIDTMLHETNHRVSVGRCIYDYATGGDICFELDRTLPPGMIAAYETAPAGLDAEGSRWFFHLQKTYLENDGQGIRELLDEVVAYGVSSELLAVGATRGLFPRPGETTFNNLPMIMSLVTRYLNELARRDPARAAAQFGAKSANRAPLLAVLARGEGAYAAWVKVVGTPGGFERVFWAEYVRGRREWEASAP